MNLFLNYQKRFLDYLKSLEKKKVIDLPDNLKSLSVELPPRGNKADMSYNVAMILAKINKKTPLEIANTLKKNFLENFKEFEKIDVAMPGFLNINFKIDFWRNYLFKIIESNANYGSNKNLKKYNPQSIKDIYKQDHLIVDFSDKIKKVDMQIKDFLRHNMYNHKKVIINTNKGKRIIKVLFNYLSKNPKKYINEELLKKAPKERVVADFIAGMTDRYAINLHKKIK